MAGGTHAVRTLRFNWAMVRAHFPEPHGAREESTRHYVTPALAAVLPAARHRRG
jgi:hypothetical protein